jgi:hypothetical protein
MVAMDSPAPPSSSEPNLATSGSKLYLSWLERAGDSASLRFSILENGRWSDPRTIVTGSNLLVNRADFPSLRPLRDGALAAHWLAHRPSSPHAYDVKVSLSRDDGRSWVPMGSPHHDGAAVEHGFVSLVAEPAGGLGAIWLDGRATSGGEAGATYLMYGRWNGSGFDAEVRLDERVCDCCQTSAAFVGDRLTVAYRDRDSEEVRDISVIQRTGDRWSEPSAVHADGWRIPACPVNGPALASRGERAAVAWFTAAGETLRVLLAFSDDGGRTFRAPLRIDGGSPLGRLDLSMLDDGSVVASWLEHSGNRAEIRLRLVRADGASSAPVVVSATEAGRTSGFPRIALLGENVVVAWTRPGPPSQVAVATIALAEFRF